MEARRIQDLRQHTRQSDEEEGYFCQWIFEADKSEQKQWRAVHPWSFYFKWRGSTKTANDTFVCTG